MNVLILGDGAVWRGVVSGVSSHTLALLQQVKVAGKAEEHFKNGPTPKIGTIGSATSFGRRDTGENNEGCLICLMGFGMEKFGSPNWRQ